VASNQLNCPYGLALDSNNSLYITDSHNNRIQKWLSGTSTGITLAGLANGTSGASSTVLSMTTGIVLDSLGNMYFSDSNNHRVMYWANGASSGIKIAGVTGKKNKRMHL
jgi:sugar lactone lactonase YvrE